MKMNGWQRLYCIIVVLWVGYLGFSAYSDTTLFNERIVELTDAVARAEAQQTRPEDDGSLVSAIRHHAYGSPDLATQYQHQLNAVQESKIANLVFLVFLAIIPPILLYFIIAWVAAGFRQQSRESN